MNSSTSFLKSSTFYFALALIILAGSTAYGIFEFQIYKAESAAYSFNKAQISVFEKTIKDTKTQYKELKDVRAPEQQELDKKIASILPEDENYIDLTRQLDNYFADHDRPGNPMFQSSLRFGKGAPVKDMDGVSVLPISMNIESTRDNFFKFLDFVENSGSLDNGIRLMEIKSIQLNFPDEGEVVKDLQQKISFNVEMNAYFQTPKTARGGDQTSPPA